MDDMFLVEKPQGSKNPADMLTNTVAINKTEVVFNFSWLATVTRPERSDA